jgi:hypothetical protein
MLKYKGRFYFQSRVYQPDIFYYFLPIKLFQKFMIQFFNTFHDSQSKMNLTIVDIKDDEGCPSVHLQILIYDRYLKEFSQFIKEFCQNNKLPLQDNWNNLKLNK